MRVSADLFVRAIAWESIGQSGKLLSHVLFASSHRVRHSWRHLWHASRHFRHASRHLRHLGHLGQRSWVSMRRIGASGMSSAYLSSRHADESEQEREENEDLHHHCSSSV